MFALYKLQAKVWFANFFNKIDFIMTVMFLSVMGSLAAVGVAGQFGGDIDLAISSGALSAANLAIVSSVMLMMVASSAINTFGMSFFEMKESVLLKRIGATEITKPKAIGAFILWGMTSMLMIVLWMVFIIFLFQIPAMAGDTGALGGILYISGSDLANVDWAGVILAIIIVMVSFYAIAFFFISISKDVTAYQMIGTFYFFLATMLGGSFTPNASREWMDVIGFLSPLGWGGDMMAAATQGNDWWNIVDGFDQMVTNNGIPTTEHVDGIKLAGNIFMPIIYGGLAGLAAAKFFKWD